MWKLDVLLLLVFWLPSFAVRVWLVAVAKARPWARCGLLGFDAPAALAMFLECIRDVGEWVREG